MKERKVKNSENSQDWNQSVWWSKKSRLRWFGHVERKDDNNWVKRCITWEVEGIRQRTPEKDLVGLC